MDSMAIELGGAAGAAAPGPAVAPGPVDVHGPADGPENAMFRAPL